MLLDEIIDLAADDKRSIGVLLRRCLVLAHQIRNERLKTWATKELNGYQEGDDLPEYRLTPAQANGNFVGWGHSQVNGYPIPPAVLEERHRKWATTVHLTQAIGAYEDLIKRAKPDSTITQAWPTNLSLYYQDRIPLNNDMNLVSAYQEIPLPSLVELLETVRNRVLSFALEIRSEVGREDQSLDKLPPVLEKRVDQIFIQQITGGNFNIASGGSTISIQQQNIEVGNWQQLERALQNSGVSQPELKELNAAVQSDKGSMGSAIGAWIKKIGPKVLTGGVKIGTTVGQAVLTEYLKKYFGLPS
jgi:hypothetical protein